MQREGKQFKYRRKNPNAVWKQHGLYPLLSCQTLVGGSTLVTNPILEGYWVKTWGVGIALSLFFFPPSRFLRHQYNAKLKQRAQQIQEELVREDLSYLISVTSTMSWVRWKALFFLHVRYLLGLHLSHVSSISASSVHLLVAELEDQQIRAVARMWCCKCPVCDQSWRWDTGSLCV